MTSFYFYDVETSGFRPREARIMQFAGQRTDMNLKPVGKPDNFLIKLNEDVLPDPDAVLVHGITPQVSRADGITEAEFLHYFSQNISLPETIFLGYNSIRFDDEFMRFTLWRNFYDAYEWQYKERRSKWDLLDAVRMMRALRPDGIEWPFAPDGRPSNRLELVAGVNKLEHDSAHDALSDVNAVIAVARLINNKQPKLFEYLLKLRDKSKVAALVEKSQMFVYTSGRYPSEHEKTTVVVLLAKHPEGRGAFVYDLRVDPEDWADKSPKELAAAWSRWGKDAPYFPIKLMIYNRCPAIAPLSVLDKASQQRLKLDMSSINNNLKKLLKIKDFGDKVVAADEHLKPFQQPKLILDELSADGSLYDTFVSNDDKNKMSVVRAASEEDIKTMAIDFIDNRLKLLLPLYKARNFPKILSALEKNSYESFKQKRLLDGGDKSRAAAYFGRIEELRQEAGKDEQEKYLLEELELYGQSILPPAE